MTEYYLKFANAVGEIEALKARLAELEEENGEKK